MARKPTVPRSERLIAALDAADPADRPRLALAMLHQPIERAALDTALALLADAALTDADRPVLRWQLEHLLDHKERDQICDAREAITRLLIRIGSPADLDLYQRGIAVHEQIRGVDVGQKLRAAALVGISTVDPALGVYYAVHLLQDRADTSRFSGEPAVTAIRLLAAGGQHAAIYQLLLAHPGDLVGEVAAAALESLGNDFPPDLYRPLVEPYLAADRAVPLTGAIAHITGSRCARLYDLLPRILTTTRDVHLYNYGVIALAASRDPALVDQLAALIAAPVPRWPEHLRAAVLLLPEADPRRADLLERLS